MNTVSASDSPVQGRLLLEGDEREDLPHAPSGGFLMAESTLAGASPTGLTVIVARENALPEPDEAEFYWSASRLRRILQCPRQYRYVYVDRLPVVPGAPMVFGRILHEIIRRAHEAQMENGVLPPIDDLLAEFDGAWSQLGDNMEMDFPKSGPPRQQYTTLGHEMLRIFRSEADAVEAPLAVELPFEIEVEIQVSGETRLVKVRGVIDRLDEIKLENGEPALIIVDYKSSRKKLNIADAQEEIQLTLYALAAQRLLRLPVEQVELFGLNHGETVAASRTQAHLDWLTQQVLPYAQRIVDNGSFKAASGYWCRWCQFRQQCDAEGPGPWLEPNPGGEENGETD